jgi:hypothetical protein
MRDIPTDFVFDQPVRFERGRSGTVVLCGPDGARMVLSRRAAGLSHDGLADVLGRGTSPRAAFPPTAVRIIVAALLVPMMWIVLAGLGLAVAVTVMPARAAREWLPMLALAVLAVAAWLAWLLAPRLIAAGKQWQAGPVVPPPRARPHLRVVK